MSCTRVAGIRVGRSFIIDSKLETEAAVTIWLLHSTMGTGTQLINRYLGARLYRQLLIVVSMN